MENEKRFSRDDIRWMCNEANKVLERKGTTPKAPEEQERIIEELYNSHGNLKNTQDFKEEGFL